MSTTPTGPNQEGASRRRRRSSDPYFALWSLCTSNAERPGVLSATVIDDYFNIIASAGNADLAGLAVWNARTVAGDEQLQKRVQQQAKSFIGPDGEDVKVTRRYAFVSPQRDAFQFIVISDSAVEAESIAESGVAAVHRILQEQQD
jgi:hypothetical protein